MQVLLTHGYFLNEDEVEKKIMKPYPPIGLLYISGFLEEKGIEHSVFDTTFSSFDKLIRQINSQQPDFLGVYVNFLTRKNVLKIIGHIKNGKNSGKTKVVLGGPDVRFYTENYLASGADFVVIGEGEVTFYELLTHEISGRKLSEIEGLAWMEDGKIKINRERIHLRELDSLPLPNRKKIDIEQYLQAWKSNHGYSSITVSTQRGCPYTCRWCSHTVFGDTYRRRSPASVTTELKMIKKDYNPDSIWFVDDVFTMSERWMMDFQKELNDEELSIGYECITRADKLSENIIGVLNETGCHTLWIGAESGSQRVIDLMDRRVDVKHVRQMIKLARQYGIKAGTFIMLGYPGENLKDIRETIAHLKESNPDVFTINKAYPIKGTKMYDEVRDYIIDNPSWKEVPDKDIDFKRTYGRRFYDFAIRKIYNEVNSHKNRLKKNYAGYFKYKIKSTVAGLGMLMTK
ncbi:MAG: B12-binding domain-containing radical SAM protein [Bacteroidales bacterium]|nr:B12-binding domain-containing radical SAM protein [Bacteroidales bacterium]